MTPRYYNSKSIRGLRKNMTMCYHNLLQLWLLQIAANVLLQFVMAGTSLQITTGVTIHNGTLTCK